MIRTLVIRGMLAGIAAGLAAFLFAAAFGEPPVDAAIAVEAAGEAATHAAHGHEHEVVSRGVQSTAGLLTATTAIGLALGCLVALVFAGVYGRVSSAGARATALAIAAGGFVVFVLVPLTKYPPNPPAVGDPDTIGARTWLYFGLILTTVIALAAAVQLAKRRAASWGTWNAALAGTALFLALTAVAQVLLPAVDEVSAEFPAAVLWEFRLASAGTQLVLWTTLGLAFGWAAERALAPQAAPGRRSRGRDAWTQSTV